MSEDRGGTWGANFVDFLKEVDFPATKQDLIDYAEDNNLPQEVVDKLEDLPDKEYNSFTDLIKGSVFF